MHKLQDETQESETQTKMEIRGYQRTMSKIFSRVQKMGK